jgi:MGT family glycosyltransferase
MSKHVVFAAPPAHGHVNPTLPLVEELVRRGHRVSYVTGARSAPSVRAAGATLVEVPWNEEPPPSGGGAAERGGAFDLGFLTGFFVSHVTRASEAFPALLEHFRRDRPDAVCYDGFSYAGPALADVLEVPGVALIPGMASNEHFNPMATFTGRSAPDSAFDRFFGRFTGALADFKARYGLRHDVPASPLVGSTAPLTLVFVPREFQIAGDTFDATHRFLGPSPGSRASAGDWRPPANGAPVLFVSLGTTFNHRPDFFARCVEAFRDSEWHVVMAVHEGVELPPLPQNVEVAPFFPQLAVLEHTSVFLSHTGVNSTMEALYLGVPLVSIPQMPEQALNGDRVAELGLGVRLDTATVTARLLRDTVDRVARDPVVRANVTEMGERLRATDGAALGADAIEELLGERAPAN